MAGRPERLTALDRDDQGRPVRCQTETDGKVKSIKSVVRFTYDGPTRLSWTQEKGDLKSVDGSWELTTLGMGAHKRPTRSTSISAARSACWSAARSSTSCATCWSAPAPAS